MNRVPRTLTDRKLRLLILLMGLAVLLFHYGYKERPDNKEVEEISRYLAKSQLWLGKYPPDFSVTQLDGGTFTLSDLVGKKIIALNFFATWCEPCVEEMPELNEYFRTHRGEDFVLLGVDVEEKEEKVRKFVAEHRFEFPVVADSAGTLKKLYGVESFPTTILVGPDGKIALYEMGPVANAEVTFEALLRHWRGQIAKGQGIGKDAYLERVKQQKLELSPEEPEKDAIVLEGRARKLAERMSCMCGCGHKLLECNCDTGTRMKRKLKELKTDDPRSDEEIISEIDAAFCVGSNK